MQAPIQTRPPRQTRLRAGLLLAVACCITTAQAQIIIPANNLGTDGVFNPTSNITIPLGAATTGNWEDAGNGNGIYDAEKWAVVYKFSSVNIPSGVTVRFANHPSGAPVVWLVSGDVVINGTVNLNGAIASGSNLIFYPQGGPGGFAGSKGAAPRSAGFGPGGGQLNTGGNNGGSGGYGTAGLSTSGGSNGGAVYGTHEIIPLIGGSGGGGNINQLTGGGGGGGAILIASQGQIIVNGTIVANGGDGTGHAGSGGAIRLVSDTLSGTGLLNAIGGFFNGPAGGFGRIRTETNFDALLTNGIPARSRAEVGTTARLWPQPGEPMVRVLELGEEPVPADPRSLITFGDTDVEFQSVVPAVIRIEAENVPLQASVNVRVVPVSQAEQSFTVPASFVSGSFESSIWEATLPLNVGVSAFQATVTLP